MPELVGRFERHVLPDGETIWFEPERHIYCGEINPSASAKGGYSMVRDSRLTGISTIAKSIDSDPGGLLWWATKLDQTGIAELARLTLPSGDHSWLLTQESIAAALRDAGLTWEQIRDRAAERGTNVHELIFAALSYDQRPPSLAALSESERGYGQAAFAWWRDREPKPVKAETVTADVERGVAGRFDLLCEIDGATVLVDAKTRERGNVRKADHVQLEGYELCNEACGIGGSDRRMVLVLRPDGTYAEHIGAASHHDFIAALEVYRRGTSLGKRMAEKAVA